MSKFELGQVVETAGVNTRREKDKSFDLFVLLSFERYVDGDWGDVCEEDWEQNDEAVKDGERIMGVYIYDYLEIVDMRVNSGTLKTWRTKDKDPDGLKIWIVTEWDRSVTTILFPSEW